jgi:uncharacterized protein (UPF0218 family)
MIQLSHGLSVELAIACEDVREERGNKISVMGMFTDQVAVAEFPADIRVAFFFTVRSPEIQNVPLKVRVTVDGEEAGLAVVHLVYTTAAKLANVILPMGAIRLQDEGHFAISMRVEDSEEWVEVLRKTVTRGPVT